MIQWETCKECGKPNAEGLLVCYACAADMIRWAKARGEEHVRVTVDGITMTVPKKAADAFRLKCSVTPCALCGGPTRWLGRVLRCSRCNYHEDER